MKLGESKLLKLEQKVTSIETELREVIKNFNYERVVEPWGITIDRRDNGYLITGPDTNLVIPIGDTGCRLDELEALKRIVFEISLIFGVHNSDHEEYNLDIKIVDSTGVMYGDQ